MAKTQNTDPMIMYGLRRPNRDLELSARRPGPWLSASDKNYACVAVHTDKGLDDEPRKRSGEEHKSHM
jgi:hypothetical protein